MILNTQGEIKGSQVKPDQPITPIENLKTPLNSIQLSNSPFSTAISSARTISRAEQTTIPPNKRNSHARSFLS